MIGWIHCFETKADCHLGVARKQKEKEGRDGGGEAAARDKICFSTAFLQ